MAPIRVKLFTGAPEARSLELGESALTEDLLPAFRDNARQNTGLTTTFVSEPSSCVDASWRLLHLKPPFHSPTLDKPDPTKSHENGFVEQSLAILDDIQSSQLPCHEETTFDDPSTLLTFSTDPLTPTPARPRLLAQIRGPLTALVDIPPAPYLLRLRPQTMTVAVVAGIISISPARTVHVRRGGGYDMDIVEVLLGDETKAGFSVTAWLPPLRILAEGRLRGAQAARHNVAAGDDLRHQIAELRRGDVVYFSPLALTVFNDKVFGQTLDRRASGVRTVVARVRNVATFTPDIRAKIDRVEHWVDDFVGVVAATGFQKKRAGDTDSAAPTEERTSKQSSRKNFLPPDSQ